MKTVSLYEYEEPISLLTSDPAPRGSLKRRHWVFEIRCESGIKGIEVRLRSVVWQSRASARHKWANDRAWHWSVNDVYNRRGLPSDYLVAQRPEVPSWIAERALMMIRDLVRFESEMKR